jgi:hypothetical protein
MRATFPAKAFSDDIARLLKATFRRPETSYHQGFSRPGGAVLPRSSSLANMLAKGTSKGKALAPPVRFPYNSEVFLYPRSPQAWRIENSALARNDNAEEAGPK